MSINHETMGQQKQQINTVARREQQLQNPVQEIHYIQMYEQRNRQKLTEQAEERRQNYLQEMAHVQDTAKLGKKSFKSNTAEKKLRNEKIDRAKNLTARATAHTLDIYEQLQQLKQSDEEKEEREKARAEELSKQLDEMKANQMWPGDDTKEEAALWLRLQSVEEHYPKENFFLTSELQKKDNFMRYLNWIEEYEALVKLYDSTCEDGKSKVYAKYEAHVTELKAYLGPVIEALRHRMEVYCEQNRVSMTGEILDEAQEGARLTDEDITGWLDKAHAYNVWKHHSEFTSCGPVSDEERIQFRNMREEAGRADVLQVRQPVQIMRLTREEAIATPSDLNEQVSRQNLQQLNDQLHDAGLTEVANIVQAYIAGTRYTVGYTEERERLKKAIAAVKAAKKQHANGAAAEILSNMQNYFDQMTNGTLEVPQGFEIDYTKEELKETGGDGAGSTRNAMLRGVMHWSDQKDTPLFSHEPVVNDLKQRLVSNCYMVAAVTGLVNLNPNLLKECIVDNGDGTVTVRLFDKIRLPKTSTNEPKSTKEAIGEELKDLEGLDEVEIFGEDTIKEYDVQIMPVYVKITKEIPRIAGMDALSAGALWMQMIEKACAYLGRDGRTGYQSLWYGEGGEFLQRLLGVEPVTDYKKDGARLTPEAKETLFQNICNARARNEIYNAGTGSEGADGLNSGHAYAVLGGKVENGKKYVLLRNPYSTHSMQQNEKGEKSTTGFALSINSDETYGQFYMEYDEFLNSFAKVTHTKVA